MSTDEPCYLYGFLRTPPAPLPDMVGVFNAPVRTQADGEMAAVISPMPPGQLRAARDDVIAHSEVLQALLPDHDVVPAAFGTVYPNGFDLAELPRGERRSLSRLMDDLSGRVELQVRATYDEPGVTAMLVESDSRLRRLRQAKRQDYATKLAMGTRFAELLDRQRRSDVRNATKRVSRAVERVSIEDPNGEWGAFRLALLVQRKKLDDVVRILAEMADGVTSYLTVDWVGPVPPYTFVATTRRAG
jgi:hypothetical protein